MTRKKTRTLLLLAIAALLAPALHASEKKPLPKDLPPFGEDKPLPVPTIAQSKLPNGLTVWVVKRSGYPRAVVKLAVRGGSAADPKEAPGISDLLADTLKEGTTTRTSRQIAEELQAVGAEIGADEAADAIYVTATGLGSGAPKMLEIVADIVRNPTFPAAEVELAKGNALEGAQGPGVDARVPGRSKALAQAVYGDHPYHVIGATKETLQAATVDQLKKEHARRFRPEGALLVVVGDVDAAAVTAAVNRFFCTWKGTGEAPAPTPAPPAATSRRFLVVNRPGSVQSQILLGRPVVTVTDPRVLPAARGQHDLRRLLRQPPGREHPRGQGLHLLARRRHPGPPEGRPPDGARRRPQRGHRRRRSSRCSTSSTAWARPRRAPKSCRGPSATRPGSTSCATRSRAPWPRPSPRTG